MMTEVKCHELPLQPKTLETKPGLELGSIRIYHGSSSSILFWRDCCTLRVTLALDSKPHAERKRVGLTSYCISGNWDNFLVLSKGLNKYF